jgi:uncharacterized protein YndB with AHSA1/START domain
MSNLQARNETIIKAPAARVWAAVTDIKLLPKINPGVIAATGRMDQQGATRTCEMSTNGRKGTMTERLAELVPGQKTVWVIESDSMGMTKMLSDPRFCFYVEKIDEGTTRLINESYYTPATVTARVMNALFMKRKMGQIQEQILQNVKSLVETK